MHVPNLLHAIPGRLIHKKGSTTLRHNHQNQHYTVINHAFVVSMADRSMKGPRRDHAAATRRKKRYPRGSAVRLKRKRCAPGRPLPRASSAGQGGGARGGPSRFRRPRLILKRKGALVMGIRGLCSVFTHSQAFRRSARSKLTTYLVKASFHTRREPRCFRRDRLILTPKSGLVVGIRDLCSVWAHSAAFRFSDQSKNRSLRHI